LPVWSDGQLCASSLLTMILTADKACAPVIGLVRTPASVYVRLFTCVLPVSVSSIAAGLG
jgi:hypothetical protein